MRWWFDSVWVLADWSRGDASASCNCDFADDGVLGLERCFWRASEVRRLEERKRLRDWRARISARIEEISASGSDSIVESLFGW